MVALGFLVESVSSGWSVAEGDGDGLERKTEKSCGKELGGCSRGKRQSTQGGQWW